MRSDAFLVFLAVMGSALCWWPVSMEPNLDLPLWVPLACAALCIGLSTTLSRRRWSLFVLASAIGAFGGLCLSYAIWWPSDPIAGPLVPYSVAAGTIAVLLLSLVAGLAGRKLSPLTEAYRSTIWVALLGLVAFGPVTFALTPPLVGYRIARNDRVAAERFASLKNAVERTAAEAGDPKRICGGSALQRHYAGPPFSDEDWRRITGNYVKQDGYFFMVYCRENGGYTVDAGPVRDRGDGTRRFCTDESGRLGCGMEWNRSRNKCLPCMK
jgi:hypothetical protein